MGWNFRKTKIFYFEDIAYTLHGFDWLNEFSQYQKKNQEKLQEVLIRKFFKNITYYLIFVYYEVKESVFTKIGFF